jgi:hypothetical protein
MRLWRIFFYWLGITVCFWAYSGWKLGMLPSSMSAAFAAAALLVFPVAIDGFSCRPGLARVPFYACFFAGVANALIAILMYYYFPVFSREEGHYLLISLPVIFYYFLVPIPWTGANLAKAPLRGEYGRRLRHGLLMFPAYFFTWSILIVLFAMIVGLIMGDEIIIPVRIIIATSQLAIILAAISCIAFEKHKINQND